ncbi:tail fiber domain-containing protein, partial [Staphylococcus haemolyticus]
VSDVVAGKMEYYERKIFKGTEPPENPQNDTLWYDTSNPDVAVLRRYWNGKWITQTADDVEKIGGLRREQVMYRDLNNSFINLTIQHSKLQNDVYDVLNSEYLVDDDLKTNLNQALLDLDSVYQNIKANLNSMDEETATIGKLVDTQTLFTVYREKLQTLYKYVTEAKISIDRRLKLLQSQYTDEKFNEALTKVANKFGLTVDGNNNMVGTPDVVEKAIEASRIDTQEQLKSYVKSVDYETDKNGIVERLDSADSDRVQLANKIEDRVTITKFESDIYDVKQETQNYTNDEINNLDIGSENLLLDSKSRSDFTTNNTHSLVYLSIVRPLEIGETYTFTCNFITTDERQSGQTSVYPYKPSGIRTTVNIKNSKITYTFTAQAESTQFLIYKDVAGQSDVSLDVTIENAILVKGNKVTDWSLAPRENEKRLSNMETSISQNGREIQLKASQQDFNASRKTLSQVISEISATTKGINLSYDENGNIQSYTMDRNGIQLRGDKVDITVNKDFNVMASKVDDKVGKNEIINRLNLSPEGLDINVNNIGIRGGDNVDYLDIRNNSILSYGSFTRTWANETDTANLRLGIQGGTVKIQNRTTGYNLYLTEKGLSTMLAGAGDETAGTLEFHSTKYNDRSRGVRLHSTYGAVALESDYSRIILNSNLTANIESNTASVYIRPMKNNRKGTNEFRFWTKLNDTEAETDGVLSYGSLTELPNGTLDGYSFGSSIRFEKNPKSNTIYATDATGKAGTGNFYALNFIGDLWARNTNIYAQVDNEFRITDRLGYNGGTPNYKNLRVNSINTISSYAFSNRSGGDTYFGVGGGELRVTNNNHYNGGNTSYRNIRFGKWYAMSSEKYKYDIKEWDYSVLDAYRNDLKLYSYKYKSEEDSKYIRNHHGVVIERELPIEWRHGDGFDGNEVMFWNTKAIQELIKKVDKLEGQLNEQSITS